MTGIARIGAAIVLGAGAFWPPARAQEASPPANLIDAYFAEFWKAEGVTPGPAADDYAFFRRLTLDVYGRLPSPEEIRSFAADRDPDKRARAAGRMLASDESAEFFADVWLDALIDHDVTNQDFARADLGPLRAWVRRCFHEDTPYDRVVRSLLSDRGPRREKPAVNFSLKHLGSDPLPVKLAVMSARLFLGKDIRCAQCHDDPFQSTTQEEFWGFTAFFRPLQNAGDLVERTSVPRREPRDDFHEMPLAPRFFDGREPESGRRLGEALADFTLTTRDHACSKAFVNRAWKHFFGRWLMPVSTGARDRRHPDLAERLALDFEKNGWSPRRLMRAILESKAYGVSSAGASELRDKYAIGPLKAMGSIQYFKVFQDVFDLYEAHKKAWEKDVLENENAGPQFKDPEVMRLLFYKWSQELLLPKGRDPEETAASGTPRMAMRLMNNQSIQSMVNSQWGLLKRILRKKFTPEDRIEEMFLAMIGRRPESDEKHRYVRYVKGQFIDKMAYEDVFWMLLNSAEFLFNH
ncbi:MAG: DUF1549 domain-containing protein [Planctomycetes bacterium]|nr:DUF1549 domain-containing protein [Planctomycetota bacterium]